MESADKYKEVREKRNAYKRTEEYKAKRRATRDLSKDRERWAQYAARPEVKEYLRQKAKQYNARPEVKERLVKHRAKEYAEKGKQRGLDNIKNLNDNYVKSILVRGTNLTYKDIPKALVEVKKLEILIKRDYLANTTPTERLRESKKKSKARNPNAAKNYYLANKQKYAEAARLWREKNKEKYLTVNYAWREANKEKIRAQERARYHKNKENQLERGKKYREENREALRERSRSNYAKNKEAINAKRRNLTPEQREHINALARAAAKRRKLLTKEKENEERN